MTTPGPLASRWDRMLGELIDGMILVPLTLAVGWPFLSRLLNAGWADVQVGDAGSLAQAKGGTGNGWLLLGFLVAAFVLAVIYRVVLWLWRGATLGQSALRLRVQPWSPDERLVVRHVYLRATSQWLFLPLVAIPVVGAAAVLLPVLDVAWTAWSSGGRTLHDVLAGTCVTSESGDEEDEWLTQLETRSELDLYEDQE